MGSCESTNANGNRKARSRGEGLPKNKRTAIKMPKLAKADLDNSSQIDDEQEIDKRIEILRRGEKKELQKLIENYDAGINDYTFGQNKTLLLEACIVCNNPAVIDMIMAKGADIDKEEYQTGNTAIFLSALDLKVDFVRNLLKYQPNLQHRNHSNQNIIEFLEFQLIEQRQKIGRELTNNEKERYQEIKEMLLEQGDL